MKIVKSRTLIKTTVWLIIVLILSLVPGNSFDTVPVFFIPHIDKIVHFGMYSVLTGFLLQLFNKPEISFTKSAFICLLISFSYGVLMELLQEITASGRGGDVFDVFANSTGIVAAIVLFPTLQKIKLFRIITG
jgi:VanZ family protein